MAVPSCDRDTVVLRHTASKNSIKNLKIGGPRNYTYSQCFIPALEYHTTLVLTVLFVLNTQTYILSPIKEILIY